MTGRRELPGFGEVARYFLALGLVGKPGEEQEKARRTVEECQAFLLRRGVTNPLRHHFAEYLRSCGRREEAASTLREVYEFARSKWLGLLNPLEGLSSAPWVQPHRGRMPPGLATLLRRAGVGKGSKGQA